MSMLAIEDFIPRQFWGPREPGYPLRIQAPVPYVFVGYVRKNYLGPQAKRSPGPDPDQLGCCQELCYILNGEYNNKLPDIRFNFMICGSSSPEIYEGRGWTRQPTLPLKYQRLNSKSWYIGIIGDYSETDAPPAVFERIDTLLSYAMENDYLAKQYTRVDLANPFKRKEREIVPQNYISSIYL
ncbi:uncharacterized protein LOC129000503 [Macrosteles quadrilineatus]|uniref:uncharacterized protein LOC129000503 n=1 Tax=Macrosteles quadrilineatus TaxID=74068 RepID=UPI0023E27209|nr:uncharacterized protein LOC129000503 [Macrosteles quadrilineatus]